MNQKYLAKISGLLAAVMLSGAALPVYATEESPAAPPSAKTAVILSDEENTETLQISANYYHEEGQPYTIHFTTLTAIPACTKLEAKIRFADASVISASFDDAVLGGATKEILRGEDYATYALTYSEAAPIAAKTRVFSLQATSSSAPTAESLVISDLKITKADGSVQPYLASMTIQEGPIVPDLNEAETAVYDAIVKLPKTDTLSFYQESGSLTDLSALQKQVSDTEAAYKKLSADSQSNVVAVLEYNGYTVEIIDQLTSVLQGMNNALGLVEIASLLKDVTAERVLNYQFLLKVFQTKKDFINLANLPQGSAVLKEAQDTVATLDAALVTLNTAYDAASYATKAYACQDQISVIQGLSAHKYYADYLTALSDQITALTEEVTKNYDGRDKEDVLQNLNKAKATVDLIKKGMNDLPTMKIGQITIRKSFTVTFTRKNVLDDSLDVSVMVKVMNKNGTVLDTSTKDFPSDEKSLTISILARTTYPKNENVTVEAYYIVDGAEFLIDTQTAKALYFPEDSSIGGLPSGNHSTGGGTSSSGSKDDNKGGVVFPGASDEPEEEPTEETELFGDLKNYAWAKEAIETLYYAGIINGMEENVFLPNGPITREQFAKMVAQLFSLSINGTRTNFVDVNEDAWYAPYISATLQAGYIQGQSDEYFGVGESIMRQDMATILYRALGNQNSKVVLEFTDNDQIADYAKDAVAELVGLGIINGYEDGSFQPRGTATRAEAAKMIYGIYVYLNQDSPEK